MRVNLNSLEINHVYFPSMSSPNFRLSGGSLGYWTACNNFKRYCTLPYCVYELIGRRKMRQKYCNVNIKLTCKIDIKTIFWQISALTQMFQNKVMINQHFRQVTSHHLSQCWSRSMSPYVTIKSPLLRFSTRAWDLNRFAAYKCIQC